MNVRQEVAVRRCLKYMENISMKIVGVPYGRQIRIVSTTAPILVDVIVRAELQNRQIMKPTLGALDVSLPIELGSG